MRIALDYTAAVNQRAGIGRFLRSLVKALAEIDRSNEYLLVHARANPDAVARYPEGPNFRRVPLWVSEKTLNILWHRLSISLPVDWLTGRVDIFHSPDFVLPPLRHGRAVVTVHDLSFLLHPECAVESLRSYLEVAVPRAVQRADLVLADSQSTLNDAVCLLSVPEAKVRVVHGGVDDSFSPADPSEAAHEVSKSFSLEKPYILFVGMLEPRKNVGKVIEAFGLLKQRLADLPHELVVAGAPGWLWQDVHRQAQLSPQRESIRFLGFVPDEALPWLYRAADMFVYPSYYEGFGLPPLEAMACGTPAIVSNTSSFPEVVGDAGLMVDPKSTEELTDAMETLLLNRELRESLVARGLARAQSFRWSRSAGQLLEAYEAVVQQA